MISQKSSIIISPCFQFETIFDAIAVNSSCSEHAICHNFSGQIKYVHGYPADKAIFLFSLYEMLFRRNFSRIEP